MTNADQIEDSFDSFDLNLESLIVGEWNWNANEPNPRRSLLSHFLDMKSDQTKESGSSKDKIQKYI